MNFARDVVEAAPPDHRALVELARDGSRREWSFGEVADHSARLAGSLRSRHGVGRGDVVMTLIGSRPEWVLTMIACFRLGAVALACNEQLRAHDLAQRLAAARPTLIVADERNLGELSGARPDCPVLTVPDEALWAGEPAPAVELELGDPCLITFTSGTTGDAKGVVHGQRYLPGQRLQAEYWLDGQAGELVWCTAATGWSKSARNVFIAPWLRGAAHCCTTSRFDAARRLELLSTERVNVLCMAPTEYRVMAKRVELHPVPGLRSARRCRRGAEPRGDPRLPRGHGARDPRRLRPDRDRPADRQPLGQPVRLGSMGRPLPGVDLMVSRRGARAGRPEHRPHLFRRIRRRRAGAGRASHGGRAIGSPATTTAIRTSRGAPTM